MAPGLPSNPGSARTRTILRSRTSRASLPRSRATGPRPKPIFAKPSGWPRVPCPPTRTSAVCISCGRCRIPRRGPRRSTSIARCSPWTRPTRKDSSRRRCCGHKRGSLPPRVRCSSSCRRTCRDGPRRLPCAWRTWPGPATPRRRPSQTRWRRIPTSSPGDVLAVLPAFDHVQGDEVLGRLLASLDRRGVVAPELLRRLAAIQMRRGQFAEARADTRSRRGGRAHRARPGGPGARRGRRGGSPRGTRIPGSRPLTRSAERHRALPVRRRVRRARSWPPRRTSR